MSARNHIEELDAQGWTRIDLNANEWVALVPNDERSAYGGTLWKRGSDGFEHAEGCTAGYPIYATLNFDAAAKQIAAQIKMEMGS